MFHRNNSGAIKPQSKDEATAQEKTREAKSYSGMDQTATRPYAASQGDTPETERFVNQNSTAPFAVEERNKSNTNNQTQNQTKEVNQMNNSNAQQKSQPQQDANNTSSQARVDIPGNNFQRPGVPAQNAARPAYPGTYPGAAPAQSSGYTAQVSNADDRKLIIGQGISLSGEIEACDHLIVEGTVEAALKGANMMDIAESGSFYGTVEIEEADIAGRFEGDITVKGRLTIQSTGVIIGSVSYKELSMEAGATLEGSVSPIGSQTASQNAPSASKRNQKAKKVSQSNSAELPFSGGAAQAAE